MNPTSSDSATRRLRLLCILNLDWNPHLGAARVYIELAERWRHAGHIVEHFSFSEAFPDKARSARQFAIRRLIFPHKAARFVRQNGSRFDVIDALIGSLAGSKTKLGFDGLLVARSVGSHRLYDRFERSVPTRWPGAERGSFAGRVFYSTLNHLLMRSSDAALKNADLINVPNSEEATFLRDECRITRPIIVQPYGLGGHQRAALSSAAKSPAERFQQKRISFVGMWAPRKGSRVWGEIVRRVRERIPDAEFSFLGTMVSPETLLDELGLEPANAIQSVPEFSPSELPALLSTCTVAAFPSYVEGFGLAILEQLAAGIPAIAFDEGGPRDILRDKLPELLVPTGDVESFANALVRILKLQPADYQRLVKLSLETAEQYSWSDIAANTIREYQTIYRHRPSL